MKNFLLTMLIALSCLSANAASSLTGLKCTGEKGARLPYLGEGFRMVYSASSGSVVKFVTFDKNELIPAMNQFNGYRVSNGRDGSLVLTFAALNDYKAAVVINQSLKTFFVQESGYENTPMKCTKLPANETENYRSW